ncbi:MAG TPA: hypothetical protein VMS65_08185 [Polyangiaceae bacterium]|nr:hypothetical protein [Polyangiaceae bacterium]
MQKCVSSLCLVATFACGAPAPDARSPAPNPAAPAPPISNAAPAPVATSAAPARPASPFHVIGELPSSTQLFGAGERGFVATPWGIVYALVGDEVVHDPFLQRGFSEDPMFSLQAIAGSWPDAAWLSTTHPAGRSGFTKLWRWDGKRWVNRQSTTESRFIDGIKPWTGGRQLAVDQAGMMFDVRFVVISGDKNVAVPAFTKRKDVQSFCHNELRVQAFDTLPSGEVVAAGQGCDDEAADVIGVARWAPGATRAAIDTLPGSETRNPNVSVHLVGMALRSPTDITVAGQKDERVGEESNESTYLAHFDGTRWREVTAKMPGVIETFGTTSDRTLVATNTRGELYMGAALDTLDALALPAELYKEPGVVPAVLSVWSRARGDVWAIVQMIDEKSLMPSRYSRSFLLHTRPATKPLPTHEEFEQKERALRLPGPPLESCTTPFVLLYTLGKKAPPDYDYPSTRAALKGHKEFAVEGVEFIEFERMGKRFFGARIPDFTLGKKLATLVKDKVPGSTPELVCHDPAPDRTLTIDITPQK